jgi:hypothetical protein
VYCYLIYKFMVENVNLSRFSHFRFDFQIKRFKVDFFNRSDFLYMEGVCVCVDVKKKGAMYTSAINNNVFIQLAQVS